MDWNQCSRSESGSFYHQAKIVRKTLIPTVLWLLLDFLSLKNDVNVPLKSIKQKNFVKNYFFFGLLNVNDENNRIRSASGSTSKCQGSATLTGTEAKSHWWRGDACLWCDCSLPWTCSQWTGGGGRTSPYPPTRSPGTWTGSRTGRSFCLLSLKYRTHIGLGLTNVMNTFCLLFKRWFFSTPVIKTRIASKNKTVMVRSMLLNNN